MRLGRQVVIWLDADKECPKPAQDRYYLISDGEGVSIGKYIPIPGNRWEEVMDSTEDFCGWKKKLGEVKFWASLPLAPEEEE